MAAPMKKSSRRRKAPPPQSPIAAFAQHFSWKWLIGWVGGISVLLGVIVAYKNAHPLIEPVVPALRGYVREYSDDVTKLKMEPVAKWMGDYEAYRIEQTLELAKINLTNLNQNLTTAKKELESYPNSESVKVRVENLEKDIRATRARIEGYESTLFAKRNQR